MFFSDFCVLFGWFCLFVCFILFWFGFLGGFFGKGWVGVFWKVGWFRNRNNHMSKGPFVFLGLATRKVTLSTGSLFEIPSIAWRKEPLSCRLLSSELHNPRQNSLPRECGFTRLNYTVINQILKLSIAYFLSCWLIIVIMLSLCSVGIFFSSILYLPWCQEKRTCPVFPFQPDCL